MTLHVSGCIEELHFSFQSSVNLTGM